MMRGLRSIRSTDCSSTTFGAGVQGSSSAAYEPWPTSSTSSSFAHMNRQLAPEVETIFLMTNEDNFFVSSSLVREVAEMGGDIGRVVPPGVLSALKKKFNKFR